MAYQYPQNAAYDEEKAYIGMFAILSSQTTRACDKASGLGQLLKFEA